MMAHTYRPLLRPASSFTLPRGLAWSFVAVPDYLAARRPDLPVSDSRHGVIATARPLTAAECEAFDLEPVEVR